MTRNARITYLVCFAAAALVAGVVARFAGWSYEALGCSQYRDPGAFLAYCGSSVYGDYEHGAYYFDLEKEAINNLRAAKVLFLGSSRTQMAFSTDEVQHYFEAHHLPYYVMGFGYDERYDFAITLIEKYQLKPDAIIVNSDPFFRGGSRISGDMIAPANNLRAIARKIWVFSDYFEKKLLSGVRWKICNLMAFLCETRSISIYRDVHNGFWIWRGVYTYEEYGHLPIDPSRRVVAKLPDVAEVEKANRLINSTHIRRDCVVLTVTPNSELDADAYSTKMAAALGARVDLPEVDGLFTSDHSHLTWSSAQRWSAKFLEEIDPIIQSCVTSHQNPR